MPPGGLSGLPAAGEARPSLAHHAGLDARLDARLAGSPASAHRLASN
jgi:hypothetical protein